MYKLLMIGLETDRLMFRQWRKSDVKEFSGFFGSEVNARAIFSSQPFSAFSAICMAMAKVEPPETPVMMPSCSASFLAQAMPSGPGTGINSS